MWDSVNSASATDSLDKVRACLQASMVATGVDDAKGRSLTTDVHLNWTAGVQSPVLLIEFLQMISALAGMSV